TSGVPRYQHIFYIMMENHSYDEVIGNAAAPQINALANEYGLATNYWGVTHPSEPNYVASVAGSNYNVVNDSPYQTQLVQKPYLGSQLEAAGLTWKTYQQSLPSVGFTGNYWPSSTVAKYASKHNPFLNFQPDYTASQWQAELNKTVPDSQLATDLNNNATPNFAYIVPDQCNDMHGISSVCSDQTALISAGDTYVANTVQMIMGSKTWQEGNNAIVITWDENDFSAVQGPTNIASAGGHVATVVIANHGPRGATYSVPSNHYSLLLTIEDAFHLGCLANSCPAVGGVQPMTPLFRASGDN
ncbi:MAG TPA: alkaline phosphatase family protein, partial [Ktedonobacterales bacterium]|nr:alkaline phosphatase family protein [Ktedonobacterales bacterium]